MQPSPAAPPDTEAQFSKAIWPPAPRAGTILSWALRYVTQLHKARLALDAGEDTFTAMRSFIPPIHFRREQMVQGRAEILDRAAA